MPPDPAEILKARIRADLRLAMKAKHGDEARALRVLTAAIDNAEAQPLPPDGRAAEPHRFDARSAEIPRQMLSPADLRALLLHEIAERETAADQMEALGRPDQAARLRAEAALARRYLD